MAYTGQKEGRCWLEYGIYTGQREGMCWSKGMWYVLVKREMVDPGQEGMCWVLVRRDSRCWSEGREALGVGQKLEGRW